VILYTAQDYRVQGQGFRFHASRAEAQREHPKSRVFKWTIAPSITRAMLVAALNREPVASIPGLVTTTEAA